MRKLLKPHKSQRCEFLGADLDIEDQAKAYLIRAIRRGAAFLVLGAGASKTSRNRFGKDVALGEGLAEILAQEAGLPYAGEPLRKVLAACVPDILGREQFHQILKDQYHGVTPSKELKSLLKFSWKRLYTWNIDDAIAAVPYSAQRRSTYNGMIDKAHVDHGAEILPVIQLHGDVDKPEHGFIFTDVEYNKALIDGKHHWYRQLAQDYVSSVPIFIGSRLEEPILSLELDRARPVAGEPLGQAFLVCPDKLSPIDVLDLRSRQIVYLQGTLEDFDEFLRTEIGVSYKPVDIAAELSEFAASTVKARNLGARSALIATYIYQQTYSATLADAASFEPQVAEAASRKFLEGAPPSWRLAVSDAPVWLQQTDDLLKFVTRSVFDRERIAMVVGQSGSGKTTALMQSLLRYSRDNADAPFYEIRGEVPSLRSALQLLSDSVASDHIIVYIADAFVFGDSFYEDLMSVPTDKMTIFSSARIGEWNSRLKRQLSAVAKTFKFDRFIQADYQPLIDRLIKFVPSPALLRMTPAQRRAQLGQSRSQLLIALKEATYAEAFTKVITREFEKLGSLDEQKLLLICGLGSLSRAGIDPGAAREAYERSGADLPFQVAMETLEGIVVPQVNGRLSARHELYVRHIYDSVANVDEVMNAVSALLDTFTKYKHPIIKNVARLDEILFRYLLSHNFLKDLAKAHGTARAGLKVYERFELAFQLDGHYWLQYGQYLSEIGDYDEAMAMFDKSIQAYPENEYALHALADCQLKVAARRASYDADTRELIRKAVSTLLAQDEAMDGPSDHYAIVTLAHGHVGTLVVHDEMDQAREAAERYLARIGAIRRFNDDNLLARAFERLLNFTTGQGWKETPFATRRGQRTGAFRR
ncbi:P-loop NTPase [Sphingomonas baiyangensis]|uniref:Tetratricopeptide repeat protein n=1 Tax=Sphingomonas baiyangensis TaxID=2572576 RepID=A0A4U1L2L3_9SPHN|nr:tetratricopeptide repeat protein [Sphingomonas baiyangensis]TKD50276.1 tetratricopeptide repeat protein [Sphingomonas baiyangensis]